MTPEIIGQLPPYAILAICIFFLVDNIRQKKNGNGHSIAVHPVTTQKINDLHDWHKISDEDGVKLWYNKPSTQREITEMNKTLTALGIHIEKNTEVITELLEHIKKEK